MSSKKTCHVIPFAIRFAISREAYETIDLEVCIFAIRFPDTYVVPKCG